MKLLTDACSACRDLLSSLADSDVVLRSHVEHVLSLRRQILNHQLVCTVSDLHDVSCIQSPVVKLRRIARDRTAFPYFLFSV